MYLDNLLKTNPINPYSGVHSHVGFLHANQTNGKSLKLTTRKMVNITGSNLVQFCTAISTNSNHILHIILTENLHNLFHVAQLRASLDELLHLLGRALHGSGDLVDILRLDHSLQVVFQDLGEVV